VTASEVAAIVFGLVAAVSGWFILHGSQARASGAALLVGGLGILAGTALLGLDLNDAAPFAFRAAACLIVPAALVVYPRTDWKDPLSFVLIVTVLGAGAVSVLWAAAVEPMSYVIVSALLLHIWWAYERGSDDERRALTWSSLAWIGAGLAVGFAGFLISSARGTDTIVLPFTVCVLAIGPPAMVVGALRPDLVDVRGLVTRTVVAATVLTTYVACAVGVTSGIEQLRGRPLESPPTIVICAVLAFGVRPLQMLLRGVVDQLLFGDRPDPLRAATRVVDRIGDDPVLALQAIREALVLPYASLRADGRTLATSGTEVTHTRTLPLQLGGDDVGEVVVGLRAGDISLAPGDEQVLRIVAPLLAQTLRAQALAAELKDSRGAAISAIEDERRRLRRDLHDGLGPTLTGVAFATDAARNQLQSDPARADALLERLRGDTTSAIAEVRRLVEGLRPPALDELGLVGALRQQTSALHTDGGSSLRVTISAPDRLPDMSAAVEVTAYRVIVEALTNVARHATATAAHVKLGVDGGALRLSVQDDGRGAGAWRPGVGMSSMRERVEQVGGTLTAAPCEEGGRVVALIPLSPAAS
jgi:two-component system NarL family sensor kinase